MVPNYDMPRSRYDLGDPYDGQLADFCEAMDGATQRVVLQRALTTYLVEMLRDNPGIRKRYDELQEARGIRRPRLIASRDDPVET
jgi:hypothetical protein